MLLALTFKKFHDHARVSETSIGWRPEPRDRAELCFLRELNEAFGEWTKTKGVEAICERDPRVAMNDDALDMASVLARSRRRTLRAAASCRHT